MTICKQHRTSLYSMSCHQAALNQEIIETLNSIPVKGGKDHYSKMPRACVNHVILNLNNGYNE
jgi:hypothetical protein